MKGKRKRSKKENIEHLQRAIRKFGDYDGSRRAALSRLMEVKDDAARIGRTDSQPQR